MRNLTLFVAILLLNACEKPYDDSLTENSPGVRVIEKTITNAMYFKKGSYWIYESDRGEIDSMWVDRGSIGFEYINKTQNFDNIIFSSLNNNLYVACGLENPYLADTQYRISIGSYNQGNISNFINADIFKPAQGNNNRCKTCTGDTAILMPTYKLDGKTYKNVWRFLSKQYRDVYDIKLESNGQYYFAEGIGLIEKQDGGLPHYYKLIRYHIEK
ncbi:MAG: hypothetical protein MUF43_05120 [Flavobacterium sp.]|jgi:hypothetical protein|nr:hypothetical protein [Flavobacterium sp.]